MSVFGYKKFTFTSAGSLLEQSYTVPIDLRSIAFQVKTGTVDMRATTGTGDDEWSMAAGDKESINGQDMAKEKIFFTGSEGAILQIRTLGGLGS